MIKPVRLVWDDHVEKFEAWIDAIGTNHRATNHRGVDRQEFRPLSKPLSVCRMALVSSAGVHLADQDSFHVETVAGDPSYRVIPDDVDMADLRFTHTHYDTSSAERDPNCVFPLDRLHDAVAEGRVGFASPVHIGMMGFNPDPSAIADETAPAVVDELVAADVDVVMLVPG